MTRTNLLTAALAATLLATAPAFAAPDFFPRSSFEPISPVELDQLDCWGLWHARNEIYARNDYRFKTAKAKAEFGSDGQQDNPHLSAVEQANIALVQKYERTAGCS